MADLVTRTGIEITAQKLREQAARQGQPITQEQAVARVVRAVNTTDRQNGG